MIITYEMLESDPLLPEKLRMYFAAIFQESIAKALLSGCDPEGVLEDYNHDSDH